MDYVLLLFLLIGIAAGGVSAWLMLRARTAMLTERLAGRENAIDELKHRLGEKETALEESHAQVAALNTKLGQLATALSEERKQAEEKLALLDDAKRKLSDAFKALAADALRSSNTSFLELAKTQLEKFQELAKGDLDKRQSAIDELVKPVGESLGKVDAKLQEIEKSRIDAYSSLTEQVKSLAETHKELRSETLNLVKALRRSEVRGRWGEIQLRRVVEMAGMLNHCDFYEQQTADTEDGRLRPDLLVRLPADKNIIVDSKTPLEAYLEAVEATDEETRTEKLKDHARLVRTHISDLGKKSYFEQFDPTPEFVVLFLPIEGLFSAALEHDPALIETGVQQNVIIATPTTLIALLRAVAYGWREERLAENAKQISDLGRELYKRLSNVSRHFSDLGKALGAATEAYNRAVGSLESRVLVSARKFKELGTAGTGVEIEELPPVETSPRLLQAPELVGEVTKDKESNEEV